MKNRFDCRAFPKWGDCESDEYESKGCYHLVEYQEAMSHRHGVAHAEIVIVEGFAG
nr:DUF1330 domain-containing protein [Pseudomonas sp. Bc-h]